MNRRGQEEVGFITLLELFAVFVLVLLGIMLAVKVYGVFFAPNKEALNTFEIVRDDINSLLQSKEPEGELSFLLPKTHREDYKGTIFAIDNEGVTDPYPPLAGASRPTFLAAKAKLDLDKVRKRCGGEACLCFSKEAFSEDTEVKDFINIFSKPSKCVSFSSDKEIRFETIPMDTNLQLKKFPKIVIKKSTKGDQVTILLSMEQLSSSTKP